MVVQNVSSLEQLAKCHIVYIPESKTNQLNAIKSKLGSSSTLIIADNPGAITKGAGINYIVKNGKQIFEISKTNLEKQNIKVGADLLTLGIQK
ncbi:MAG: YfiR family protein [Bacteroidales bacterium]